MKLVLIACGGLPPSSAKADTASLREGGYTCMTTLPISPQSLKGGFSMIPVIRRQNMLDLLKEHELMYLADIVEATGSSESTVRRDLKALAQEGEVELLRGGGVRLPQQGGEMSIGVKLQLQMEEKERIARTAAEMIYPGDIIFLDPSSANTLLIEHLPERVTVVTNSIAIMNRLLQMDMPCILLGGQIKRSTSSCIGPMAERELSGLRFSKCFLGANAVSREGGICNHDPREQSIKQLAIRCSAKTFFLIDATKFGQTALCKVADMDEHTIITDREVAGYEDCDNIIVAE